MNDDSLTLYNQAVKYNLGKRAYDEFEIIADYIWKIPNFIAHERSLELSKLSSYYPDDDFMSALRWNHESKKLDSSYPALISISNLLSVTSLFEIYLLMLVQELSEKLEIKLDNAKGQGTSRSFNYLKMINIDYKSIEFYPQINAALKIRNSFVHSSGILNFSIKKRKELEELCISRNYLSNKHKSDKSNFDEISIVASTFGKRIQITNDYSLLACSYYRDYFLNLCINALEITEQNYCESHNEMIFTKYV